jgi:hypothetical protein
MSYCAMENTYGDLADCVGILEEAMDDRKPLSESELRFARMLRDEAQQFVATLEMYEEEQLDGPEDDAGEEA